MKIIIKVFILSLVVFTSLHGMEKDIIHGFLFSTSRNNVQQDSIRSFYKAVQNNDAQTVDFLTANAAQLPLSTKRLNKALKKATDLNVYSYDVIPVLINRGADISTKDKRKYTPLMRAIEQFNTLQHSRSSQRPNVTYDELFKTLLLLINENTINEAAPKTVTYRPAPTPLALAILYRDPLLVEFLIEHGADKKIACSPEP